MGKRQDQLRIDAKKLRVVENAFVLIAAALHNDSVGYAPHAKSRLFSGRESGNCWFEYFCPDRKAINDQRHRDQKFAELHCCNYSKRVLIQRVWFLRQMFFDADIYSSLETKQRKSYTSRSETWLGESEDPDQGALAL